MKLLFLTTCLNLANGLELDFIVFILDGVGS